MQAAAVTTPLSIYDWSLKEASGKWFPDCMALPLALALQAEVLTVPAFLRFPLFCWLRRSGLGWRGARSGPSLEGNPLCSGHLEGSGWCGVLLVWLGEVNLLEDSPQAGPLLSLKRFSSLLLVSTWTRCSFSAEGAGQVQQAATQGALNAVGPGPAWAAGAHAAAAAGMATLAAESLLSVCLDLMGLWPSWDSLLRFLDYTFLVRLSMPWLPKGAWGPCSRGSGMDLLMGM